MALPPTTPQMLGEKKAVPDLGTLAGAGEQAGTLVEAGVTGPFQGT